LSSGTGNEIYLTALEAGLKRALDRAGADLAVYIAGTGEFR